MVIEEVDSDLLAMVPRDHAALIFGLAAQNVQPKDMISEASSGQHFDFSALLTDLAHLAAIANVCITAWKTLQERRDKNRPDPTVETVSAHLPTDLRADPRIAEVLEAARRVSLRP